MILSDEIMIFFKQTFTPKWTLKITRSDNTVDTIKADTINGEFRKVATSKIGDFKIKVNNTGGKYTDLWTGGETVDFYADLTDATTLKFKGRADFIKKDISKKGQVLEIEGRHIAFPITEAFVSKSYSNTDGAVIFKDLVDTYLDGLGFTYSDVSATIGTTMTVAWNNKPVAECFADICLLCNADYYIDDLKECHLFLENSRTNDDNAIVNTHNMIDLTGFGVDSNLERTKVTVIGQDDRGLPIIATAGTGTRTRKPIIDTSIATMEDAQARADAELSDLTLANIPPQAKAISYGLTSTEPGYNIWISDLRQKIHSQYKLIELTHKVGTSQKTWITESIIEKEEIGTSQVLLESKRKELALVKVDNPNNMQFSYNFNFSDETNISSKSSTEVNNGKLILTTGASDGTMITAYKEFSETITKLELRYDGANLDTSIIEVSANNGLNYTILTRNTLSTLSEGIQGTKMKIKVTLNVSGSTRPEIDSLSVLHA